MPALISIPDSELPFHEFYNRLPLLHDADQEFQRVEFDKLFVDRLVPLLAKYENKFGVCLIHRHFEIGVGERVVATGNIAEPRVVTKGNIVEPFPDSGMPSFQCFPERWTAEGKPWEYTQERTESPPQQLINRFKEEVDAFGVGRVLGLFYIRNEDQHGVLLERTEGRRNIMVHITDDDVPPDTTVTGWIGLKAAGRCTNPTHALSISRNDCLSSTASY